MKSPIQELNKAFSVEMSFPSVEALQTVKGPHNYFVPCRQW